VTALFAQKQLFSASRPVWWAGVLLSLGVGGLFYLAADRTIEYDAGERFLHQAQNAQYNINSRLNAYTDVLRGTASFFHAAEQVDRASFHRYVQGLNIASQFPALDAFQAEHPDTVVAIAPPGPLPAALAAQRFDLALVVDCLEHLSKPQGLTLLGGVRNLNASRIAALVDLNACGWKETDFFSLALQAGERFQRDEQVLTLFTYDLLDYKQVPDWLNARFWANPENFGKYWW
jgi:hypothetical protein